VARMETSIEVKDLTKNYGEITAVDHVNFEVRKGEIFGFLGPNGAGKTTTIRILTGVIKPNSGTAAIMGYSILKEPLKAKQIISVVPEMANAYIDLTAWQNLMFIGERARDSPIENARLYVLQLYLYLLYLQLSKG